MASEKAAQSPDALIKASRILDQSSAESVPDTLSNLWTLLSSSPVGTYYAAEQLILRWLLKNMNGPSASAEQFRRYPMAWSVVACVFTRIPLFALPKSLADRRFVPILEQTLKEISNPRNEDHASSDVEMTDGTSPPPKGDSKKRKRSPEVKFDLESLRTSHGCLRTADSLFLALENLVARLKDMPGDAPSNVRMGAEHVKSLFSSPAKEAAEILRPILSICDHALSDQESESAENRPSWVNIFSSLWDLHLQSSSDALDVAISLYPTGFIILAKMDRSKDLVMDPHLKVTWRQALRRFFIKNMILPARAAFLNRKDVGIIQGAVNMTSSLPTASLPVLFSLAVSPSGLTDDASGRKDREDWTQKVFEIVEEAMRTAEPVKRNDAMKIVLDTALQCNASISLGGLRSVCRQYTDEAGAIDLSLVPRIADIDVDVFMISAEGQTLLDDILGQITNLSDTELDASAEADLVKFVVSLATGSAKARNLSWFIRKWTEVLSECLMKDDGYTSVKGIWSSTQVVEAVAYLLQPSINISQLANLLEWLEGRDGSFKNGSLLVVLDAITQGVTDEDFIDSVGTRPFDLASKVKIKHLDGSMRARWWRVVERTLSQSELATVRALWTKVESDLKKALKKEDLTDPAALAAFRCCSAFWLATYPEAPLESETSTMAWAFLRRLQKDEQKAAAADNSRLRFYDSCRLVDLATKSGFSSEFLAGLFAYTDKADSSTISFRSLMLNEASLCNHKYLTAIISHAISIIGRQQGDKSKHNQRQLNTAIRILLDLPSGTLSREQREQILPSLLQLLNKQGASTDVEEKTSLMCLMIKIMKRPTFYEGMAFADLVTLGQTIESGIKSSAATNITIETAYNLLKLFEALASVTLKQMTSGWEERDRIYLLEASRVALSWPVKAPKDEVYRNILLRSLAVALETSKAKQQAQTVVDTAPLKEHLSLIFANGLASDDMSSLGDDTNSLEQSFSTIFSCVHIEQLDVLDPAAVRDRLLPSKERLERLSNELCNKGFKSGWRLKELLFRCFSQDAHEPLHICDDVAVWRRRTDGSVPRTLLAGQSDIAQYVYVVLTHMDDEARAGYVGALGQKLRDGSDITGNIIAVHRLLQAENKSSLGSFAGLVDWTGVQNVLTNRLPRSRSWAEFSVIAKTIEIVLEKKPMKQWNIEVTLSTVSTVCSLGLKMKEDAQASAKAYPWLCSLVEVIIKRHRHRLEGHFHLLITALQSLLRLLIIPWPQTTTSPSSTTTSPDQQAQAARFSRLLTLTCEPSVASVTRGQAPGALDSAPDAAKKSAAQHMYLVLVLYVKLQLERAVPRAVRAALDPGVYSVLDITTPEGRRIINEAVDASGRAIFREMYKQYVRFGKWNGV
ncbi:hypothetical protein N8I77_008348 [Diaporthe amygdali]|uniref:Nucleolar 27S pre-rRNA processing Urb2/Npa2 C-terminal domain-containing protein n=1 Tax=Phomopsis amygdali TaxID=1214568 RepID=A0AAD9W557_PHOAM|nr:hypothetical protein N8I77_008348 [Diaporthe amygdali]